MVTPLKYNLKLDAEANEVQWYNNTTLLTENPDSNTVFEFNDAIKPTNDLHQINTNITPLNTYLRSNPEIVPETKHAVIQQKIENYNMIIDKMWKYKERNKVFHTNLPEIFNKSSTTNVEDMVRKPWEKMVMDINNIIAAPKDIELVDNTNINDLEVRLKRILVTTPLGEDEQLMDAAVNHILQNNNNQPIRKMFYNKYLKYKSKYLKLNNM